VRQRSVGLAVADGQVVAADAAQQLEHPGEAAADLRVAQLLEQREGGRRRPAGRGVEVADGPGGLAQQLQDLRLGQVAERLEHQHDVVAERLDVVLVEGGDDAVDDPPAAAGEAEVAALVPARRRRSPTSIAGRTARRPRRRGRAAARARRRGARRGEQQRRAGPRSGRGDRRRRSRRHLEVPGRCPGRSHRHLHQGAGGGGGLLGLVRGCGSGGRRLPSIDIARDSGSGRPGSSTCQ
jgi:hypothetical protein